MMTLLAIYTTIVIGAVTTTLLVVFLSVKRRAAAWRRIRMMKRLGLDPDIGKHGRLQTQTLMKGVRRRCSRCPSEDLCERWLAGEVHGDNWFCPSAQTFDAIQADERPSV